MGNGLLQQLGALSSKAPRHEGREARNVAARSSEARHEPNSDWIADADEDERKCCRCRLSCERGLRRRGDNEIWVAPDHLRDKLRDGFCLSLRPSPLDEDVPVLRV